HPGQTRVGHHDHGRVADKPHRDHDRDRAIDAAALHAGVETPEIGAHFLDTVDVVTILARRAVAAASIHGERAPEGDVLHPFSELTLDVGQRRGIDRGVTDAEPAGDPAAAKYQDQHDHGSHETNHASNQGHRCTSSCPYLSDLVRIHMR